MNKELQAALEVVRANFQQEMTNLEGVNIGSADRTKDEIIQWVSKTTINIRDFVVYGLSLIEFINKGGTFEDFIDAQIDFLAELDKPPYTEEVKRHWENLLYRLYPEVGEELDKTTF